MATEGHSSDALRALIAGSVLSPSDTAYEDARRVHNGLIDRRPARVARCQGPADVQAAVRFAGERGLEIAVRGGGHNVAGNAVRDATGRASRIVAPACTQDLWQVARVRRGLW